MQNDDVTEEVRKKNAELARQEQLARETKDKHDHGLGKQDQTNADSFPASDPAPTP
ncbi:MAG TPA: hypothetical protein VMS32_04130 [Verrucomicrobiae bacterium]|jgi:hypothetical protein|nr:hypothetical protein [Verrucomicrobiae bacterium]